MKIKAVLIITFFISSLLAREWISYDRYKLLSGQRRADEEYLVVSGDQFSANEEVDGFILSSLRVLSKNSKVLFIGSVTGPELRTILDDDLEAFVAFKSNSDYFSKKISSKNGKSPIFLKYKKCPKIDKKLDFIISNVDEVSFNCFSNLLDIKGLLLLKGADINTMKINLNKGGWKILRFLDGPLLGKSLKYLLLEKK